MKTDSGNRGGSTASIQIFLVVSTCFLYLVAAGLFSRAVWYLESQQWNDMVGGDAAELGAGPGSYDILKSVWHVNVSHTVALVKNLTDVSQCCSPELNGGGGWGFFNAILGWTNSATYGSVISYNVYWIFVIIGFLVLRFHEVNGHYPLMKAKIADDEPSRESSEQGVREQITTGEKGSTVVGGPSL